MPRVIRDSDEDVETKSSTRRTRASAVSVASVTDSPRRATRSNKQLTVIESSPESLDDGNAQPKRTTRSRAATLDKSTTATLIRSSRSRKNSASSNVSETIDLESEITQKRVTRKTAAAVVGTPTKTNLRSRNLRAGSEAISTPPATRSTRVTRASSVDPINTPNELLGTPVKRRTRASMVPAQQTVAEEQEAQIKTPESLNNTVVEIDEDPENSSILAKGKSNKKGQKNRKEVEKDNSTEQPNMATSKMNEECMIDKSCASNDSNGDSTLKPITTHSITPKLESFKSNEGNNSDKVDPSTISESLVLSNDQNLIKSDVSNSIGNENNGDLTQSKADSNDNNECEHIDIESVTLVMDDLIDVVGSPIKVDTLDTLTLDIKDSYVKLNRTDLVEKIVSDKLEESKMSYDNLSENDNDNISQSNVIKNAKTAIVLVNDFVKSNEYFNTMREQQILDSGISLNNKEDDNYNTSVHNSDDQLSIISIDDTDEILSLKLLSPNGKESPNDELIIEVIPENEKNDFNNDIDITDPLKINNDNIDNCSSDKSDICLKENFPESKFQLESLIGEKSSSECLLNIVQDNIVEVTKEIGDDLISENMSNVKSFNMINASVDNVNILNNLHENFADCDSSVSMDVDDNPIVSAQTVKSPVNASGDNVNVSNNFDEKNVACDHSVSMDKDDIAIVSVNVKSPVDAAGDNVNVSNNLDENNAECHDTVSVNPDDNAIVCVTVNDSNNLDDKNAECHDSVSVNTNDNAIVCGSVKSPVNYSGDNINISDNLPNNNAVRDHSVSFNVDDNVIVSVNEKLLIDEKNQITAEITNEAKNEVVKMSEIESACEINSEKNTLDSDVNTIIETNDSANEISVEAEKNVANNPLELLEMSKSESTSNENRDNTNPCEYNDTNRNEIEPKVSLEDKNGVPCAVTDADGENASWSNKDEDIQETNTDATSAKSPEKSKRKSKSQVIDSDLDDIAENLFQDIVADEWSKDQSKRKSNEFKRKSNEFKTNKDAENLSINLDSSIKNKSLVKDSDGVEYAGKNKSRKSLEKNQADKSSVEIVDVFSVTATNEEANLSLSKKSRKSLEKKRDSAQSSDSGIQDSNKAVVENSVNENNSVLNDSRNKSRRSLDSSLKANKSLIVEDENDVGTDALSKSQTDRQSLNRSRSLNHSSRTSGSPLVSANTSKRQSSSSTRKSIGEERVAEDTEVEPMEVDVDGDSENEMGRANGSLNKSRKSFDKDAREQTPSKKDDSIADKSLNNSKTAKRQSLDKSLNKSSRRLSVQLLREETVYNAEIQVDPNNSIKDVIADKSLSTSKHFNESLKQNDDLSDKLSTSLNDSKKSKKRLSEKLNESKRKSIQKIQEQSNESENEEMEVEATNEKSPNKSRKSLNKSLNNESLKESNGKANVSLKNDVKSPKDKSNRKSAGKSFNTSVDDLKADGKIKVTGKSPKSTTKDSSINDAENSEDSVVVDSPKKKKVQLDSSSSSVLNHSLQKSIERQKYSNPPNKNNVSNIVEVNTSSEDESDVSQMPKFMFKLSDEDASMASSDEDENDIDSDIEREYNLGGKDISKYSDDDVAGDDCRASEEESSDEEDDDGDLDDFVVPDDEEEDEDEDDEDDDDDDNEDQEDEEDGDENENATVESLKENQLNASKKNVSFNNSKTSVKNTSAHLRISGFSQSSGSESDDEATEAENKNTKNRSNGSISHNSKTTKDKSTDKSSKLVTSRVSTTSESTYDADENEDGIESEDESESSSSESDNFAQTSKLKKATSIQIASPSESESEEQEGEDSYRIINVEPTDESLVKLKNKNKKLIDCSTPKPGAVKKTDFSKDNLSITASRRKSGSLNNLNDTKITSSRLSITEAASKSMKIGDTSIKLNDDVELVATPDTVGKNRQAWKLIPLNQTAHPTVEDTPGTKFLKKAKLNDSFPVLESMKSDVLTLSAKKTKKTTEQQQQPEEELPELPPMQVKKSKKRKLVDLSSAQSIDDSIIKISNKKRARFDESTDDDQQQQVNSVENGKEELPKNKKKKKNKAKQTQEEDEVVEQKVVPEKKRKAKSSIVQETEEQDEITEPAKKKKNKNKKKKQQTADGNSDDEPPEILSLKEARRVALNQIDELKATKESLKKKIKDEAERARKQKQSKSLKRLPEDVLDNLIDEPVRRPDKRQKLSRNKERSVIMPSKSMFSPGKVTPQNLHVDDGYIPLSSTGGTTQFAVVNLEKAKKVSKKTAVVLNFREKMLARNKRMPTTAYLAYVKKQKAKSST